MFSDTHFERRENRLSQLEQYTILTPQDIMDILNIGYLFSTSKNL